MTLRSSAVAASDDDAAAPAASSKAAAAAVDGKSKGGGSNNGSRITSRAKSVPHISHNGFLGQSSSSNSNTNTVRYRRTKSQTRAEEITNIEQKQRKSQPDKPCHRPRDSLFSWSSGFDNFTGLVNWGFLLLTIGGLRLFLENLLKYGNRIDPWQWFIVITGSEEGEGYPSVLLVIYSIFPVMLCLLLEKAMAIDLASEGSGICMHIINLVVLILCPLVIIHVRGDAFSLVGSMTVCFLYSVLFMKLWSYVHVNRWCRVENRDNGYSGGPRSRTRSQSISIADLQSEERNAELAAAKARVKDDCVNITKLVQYPDNLNVRDLIYFLMVPTLCYELNFPRTTRIRKRFLAKRIVEVILLLHVLLGLFQQWMIPSVRNSLVPFSNMELVKVAERLLKLSIPNHFIWLCFFYMSFHSFFNLIGELLHFGDRNFYSDWWNATNIEVFWRTWNLPVHRWCVRHLYIPLVDKGYSRMVASTMVFLFSAFFHEYLVSVPLKMFKTWAFMGMMAQMPLSHLSCQVEKRYGPRWGNVMVWLSLIVGQPLAIMMYYHDFVITNFNDVLLQAMT